MNTSQIIDGHVGNLCIKYVWVLLAKETAVQKANTDSLLFIWYESTDGTTIYVVTWNVKTYVSDPLECKMSQEWLKWCSETTTTTTTTTTTPKLNFIWGWWGGGYVIAMTYPHPPPPPQNLTRFWISVVHTQTGCWTGSWIDTKSLEKDKGISISLSYFCYLQLKMGSNQGKCIQNN